MLFRRLRALKKFDPEKEKSLRDEIEKQGGLEKGDLKAMIIAAFLVIMPVALGALLLFILFSWLFFR